MRAMDQSPEPSALPIEESETITIKGVAKSLGISRATILRWIRAKKIEGFFRIGHKWLIRKSDFESFINHKVGESSNKE